MTSEAPDLVTREQAPEAAVREELLPEFQADLVDVSGLEVILGIGRRSFRAVRGVDLRISAGEVVGLVGESGSGKSTFATSLFGAHRRATGRIVVCGVDISSRTRRAVAEVRRRAQFVSQDPYSSLDPRLSVQQVVAESLIGRTWRSKAAVRARVIETLTLVNLDIGILNRRVGELSGGQRQRVAIARALAPRPRLLVADEPLSALDTSVQAAIINLLRGIVATTGVGLLLIAHDLAAVSSIADRVYVMYRGKVMESGPTKEVLATPEHPYTDALVSSAPDRAGQRRTVLAPIEQRPIDLAVGCPLAPRCPYAFPVCEKQTPDLHQVGSERWAACHFAGNWPQREVSVLSAPAADETSGDLLETSRLIPWLRHVTKRAIAVSRQFAVRVAELVVTVFVIMSALFGLLHLTGNPAAVIAGESASRAELAAIAARYGLDQPLIDQYFRFIGQVFSLNFGTSFINGQPAMGQVMARLPATIELTLAAMLLNVVVSTAIGIAIGAYRRHWIGRLLTGFVYVAQGIPFYVLSLVMIFALTQTWHLLPSLGDASAGAWVMPTVSLAWFLIPQLSRVLGANIDRELQGQYVKLARASGASYRTVVMRHAVPNSLVGALALAGTQLAYLISGTLIVEQIFSWPGLGQLLLASITQVDFPVIEAAVIVIATYVIAVKFVTDLVTMKVDPRMRKG